MSDTDTTSIGIGDADDGAARRLRLRWLDALAAPVRGQQRLAASALVASGVLLLVQAGAIAWVVDMALARSWPWPDTWPGFAALAVALLLRAGLGWMAQRQAGQVAETVKQHLRERLYRQLQARGPLWLRQRRSGELGELMMAHGDALDGYFSGYLPVRAEVAWVPLAILAAVFCVDWMAGLILLLTAPLVPVFMMLVGWGAEAAGRRQMRELAQMGGQFADRLKGLGLIRLYGRGEDELAGIARAAEGVRQRTLKVLRIAFLSSTVLEFFASVSVALMALYLGLTHLGMLELRGSPLTLGASMFCLLLAPEFYAPLRRLAAHYHDRAGALAAVAEVERHLEGLPVLAPRDEQACRAATPAVGAGVRVERVSLRPLGATRDVLQGLSFDLPVGRRLALAGPSGCGKSTLLEALAGWLPPQSGHVATPSPERIGFAGQRPYLFQGSLLDNLRLADPRASHAQLLAAAEAAQVLRFAERLPDGLDTVIGERGFGLSGGEARRLGLARVLLRDPALVLLDEPTAFLDPDTEAALLAALDRFAAGRTVVVATHSLAVMRWAGQVLWLPQGQLKEAGDAAF